VKATFHIARQLAAGIKIKKDGKYLNWRGDHQYFKDASSNFPRGVETYSAGWFAQAHHVCDTF
jgi:hypothetical protein